jgi:hypothetical protein
MEMKHKFVNHARNVWDRAVSLLPRVDQFWYKYAYMEEMLGNIQAARYVDACAGVCVLHMWECLVCCVSLRLAPPNGSGEGRCGG